MAVDLDELRRLHDKAPQVLRVRNGATGPEGWAILRKHGYTVVWDDGSVVQIVDLSLIDTEVVCRPIHALLERVEAAAIQRQGHAADVRHLRGEIKRLMHRRDSNAVELKRLRDLLRNRPTQSCGCFPTGDEGICRGCRWVSKVKEELEGRSL